MPLSFSRRQPVLHVAQDAWEGLMNAGRAALLPQLPRLAQAAQQLHAWGEAAAARLRGAAAELQRLADQNAAFAAELAAQPGCATLARRPLGRGSIALPVMVLAAALIVSRLCKPCPPRCSLQ